MMHTVMISLSDAEILLIREELEKGVFNAQTDDAPVRLKLLQELKAKFIWAIEDSRRVPLTGKDFT